MMELKVPAIENGTVIDHIPSKLTLKIVDILEVNNELLTIGVNLESEKYKRKGIIKVSDRFLTQDEINKIAIIAPTATINIIQGYNKVKKFSPHLPSVIENIVKCGNPNCITNNEIVKTKFFVVDRENLRIKCNYCERIFKKEDIELK